jgi:hypothetical protein
MGQRDVVQFPAGEPVEVALQYREGKTISTRGGERVMFSLKTPAEHVMFLDARVAEKIAKLGPAAGERFFVCVRGTGKKAEWDCWLSTDTEKVRAGREAGVPVKGGKVDWKADKSNGAGPAIRLPAATPAPSRAPAVADPNSQLEREIAGYSATSQPGQTMPGLGLGDALKLAVTAAHAAGLYAKEIGYLGMPAFTGEDLRCMAINIQNGGR